jgi:threonyl-tRNA synthetase
MWLAPVQVTVVPVAHRHCQYATQVAARLREAGLRVEVDGGDDTVGEKIRKALTQKTPAVLVTGDKDESAGTVGLRRYGDEDERRGVAIDEAVRELAESAKPPTD